MRCKREWRQPVAALLAVSAAFGASACGGSDGRRGRTADRAFLEAMVPHHQSAIAMARVARRRAHHPQITELAVSIITAQGKEIRQINRIHRRLFDEPILPNEDAHEALGLSAADAGMAHSDSTAKLTRARVFDKTFIDAMASHHEGAIRMARAVGDQTADEEIGSLARAIVLTQSNEIEAMNKWRDAWYGAPSPAGGVPMSGAEHEGH